MSWYLAAFKKYADFSGRARRMEYWMFTLINTGIIFALAMVATMLGIGGGAVAGDGGALAGVFAGMLLPLLWGLVTFLPGIAVTVRRLHDTSRSGLWVLVAFIPFIGAIVLLVLMLIEGTPGNNQYGENPKSVAFSAAVA